MKEDNILQTYTIAVELLLNIQEHHKKAWKEFLRAETPEQSAFWRQRHAKWEGLLAHQTGIVRQITNYNLSLIRELDQSTKAP